MTYTPLDPSDAVVLFADPQAGIIERAATNDLASLRRAVADACGGPSLRTEDAALRRLAHAGVVTMSVGSIAAQLAGDFSQPKGRAALAVLSDLASA